VTSIHPSSLFSGTADLPLYVDRLRPDPARQAHPVVMIHGAFNTGSCFLVTPDGRPGWAYDFAEDGYEVFVIDWPGHGRSPMKPGFLKLSTRDVRDAIAVLLRQIGPAVLIAHSAGGPIAWSLAEELPDHVLAIVGVSAGPPANLLEATPPMADDSPSVAAGMDTGHPICAPADELFRIDRAFVETFWFAGSQAPPGAADRFILSVVPESPTVINERFNIGGTGLAVRDPKLVGNRPILVVTGDSDPRHSRAFDGRTAAFLDAQFLWLPERNIHGNGHMLMADRNSRDISRLLTDWLQAHAQ
jgi:pimeloyl-ACP methyl ester carboxylesterase